MEDKKDAEMDQERVPRTYVLLAETGYGRSGYVRMRMDGDEDEGFTAFLVDDRRDASRYVTFDNAKKKARILKEEYGFSKMTMVDEGTSVQYLIR